VQPSKLNCTNISEPKRYTSKKFLVSFRLCSISSIWISRIKTNI
jgi:hypothetical protein